MHDLRYEADLIPVPSPRQGEDGQTVAPNSSAAINENATNLESSTRNVETGDEKSVLVSYDYAIIRVVPRVENGDGFNVGAILFCSERGFLDARIAVDFGRWKRFAPALDCEFVAAHLQTIPLICAGGKRAGTIGNLTQRERFHWLVAPRSTIIQTSRAHCGLCHEPETALQKLLEKIVLNGMRTNADS